RPRDLPAAGLRQHARDPSDRLRSARLRRERPGDSYGLPAPHGRRFAAFQNVYRRPELPRRGVARQGAAVDGANDDGVEYLDALMTQDLEQLLADANLRYADLTRAGYQRQRRGGK